MAAASRAGPARALPQRALRACVVRAHASEEGTPTPPVASLARPPSARRVRALSAVCAPASWGEP